MPLMKGRGHEVVAKNIKELVGAGHDPKQAVAIALSNSRKYAKGGMVEDDEDEMYRSLGDLQAEAVDQPGAMNPEEQSEAMHFAKMLQKKENDDSMNVENYAMGGLVEGSHDTMVGNKPSENMKDGSEEPQSDLHKAMEEKKKKRRYGH